MDNVTSLTSYFEQEAIANWAWLIIVLAGVMFLLRFAAGYLGLLEIRQYRRWLWYLELFLLPLFVVAIESLFIRALGLTTESIALADRITSSVLWLVMAWLVVRGTELFFWYGVFKRRTGAEPSHLLSGLVALIIYLLAIYGILSITFERTMTELVVSSGVLVGVIGFAMQSTLSDMISGIALSIERPFAIGDWIELDDDTIGQVVDINWRSTHLMSRNECLYVVPNSRAAGARIHNFSKPHKRYTHWVQVYVPAKVPPVQVRRVLLEAALNTKLVLDEPVPIVRVNQTGWAFRYSVQVTFENYRAFIAGVDELLVEIWLYTARAGFSPTSVGNEAVVHKGENVQFSELNPDVFIQEVSLFQGFDMKGRRRLLAGAQQLEFEDGQTIVSQGEAGDSLFVILSGRVRVLINREDNESLEVGRLGAGQYFGEMSLLAGEPRSANIVAGTECSVLEIGRDTLAPMLESEPGLYEKLAHIVAERQVANEARMADADDEDVGKRLIELADQMVEKMKSFFDS